MSVTYDPDATLRVITDAMAEDRLERLGTDHRQVARRIAEMASHLRLLTPWHHDYSYENYVRRTLGGTPMMRVYPSVLSHRKLWQPCFRKGMCRDSDMTSDGRLPFHQLIDAMDWLDERAVNLGWLPMEYTSRQIDEIGWPK